MWQRVASLFLSRRTSRTVVESAAGDSEIRVESHQLMQEHGFVLAPSSVIRPSLCSTKHVKRLWAPASRPLCLPRITNPRGALCHVGLR
jgi:hypothetical protein